LLRRTPPLARLLVASCQTDSNPPDFPSKSKKQRLFKIARPSKRSRTYENDKIDKLRAMAEFGLREEDLRDLPTEPVPVKPTSYATHQSRHLYALTDVYHKAIQVKCPVNAS
ncbi:hypothetical protein COOONC_16418, partial [Cooperia oncophora]